MPYNNCNFGDQYNYLTKQILYTNVQTGEAVIPPPPHGHYYLLDNSGVGLLDNSGQNILVDILGILGGAISDNSGQQLLDNNGNVLITDTQ